MSRGGGGDDSPLPLSHSPPFHTSAYTSVVNPTGLRQDNHFSAPTRRGIGGFVIPIARIKWHICNSKAGPMKTPRNDPVASSRKAHTVLTVTFIDGTQGLLVLAFKQGDLDEKLVAEYNEKFKGSLLILVTKSRTHMFDGSLTVEMWEQAMTHVFRRRRTELGLTAEARGLILADAFTGNSSAPERLRRQAWLDDNNIKVLESIPGGWSAHGQPNDAIHQYLRFLQKIYESITLGYQTNPLIRPKLEMMTSTTVQTHRRSMSDRDLIEKDLWAWWSMPKSLCRWAWVSRGYIDVETMAE